MDSKNKILSAVKYLSLAGIISSAYSLYEYYWGTASDICNISATINCYAVSKSDHSDIFGVPVALLGVLGFILILACTVWPQEKNATHKWLLPILSVFAVMSLYFIYLSAFVIYAWCIACVISWIIIWTLLVLSVLLKKLSKLSPQAI